MPKNQSYQVMHEDDSILVVNKTTGISVIPERKASEAEPLIEMLRKHISPEIKLVHRIDKGTSGLVLFAKNAEVQKILSEFFLEGKIEKQYLAVVEGKLETENWESIDLPIFKKQNEIIVSIHPKGKKSRTLYRCIESFKNASLLEVKLLTGRTHQIRVHMAEIGYPLLVDDLYGKRETFMLSSLLGRKYKLKKDMVERPLVSRQTLHAAELSFNHPIHREKMQFKAPLPKDMKALLNQLRKNS